jgi:hypothetical protein
MTVDTDKHRLAWTGTVGAACRVPLTDNVANCFFYVQISIHFSFFFVYFVCFVV